MLVQTDGLVKKYGNILALDDFSLKIDEGATGLLGPNGAGKTTLLKLILGLTPPTWGSCQVLGFDHCCHARIFSWMVTKM